MSERGWLCEAYGEALPDGCFFDLTSVCVDRQVCSARMEAERARVYRRIQELAAAGDPTWSALAGEFAGPDDLLGGPDQGGGSGVR